MRGHDALETAVGAENGELAGVAVGNVPDRVDGIRFEGVRCRLVLPRELPAGQGPIREAAVLGAGGALCRRLFPQRRSRRSRGGTRASARLAADERLARGGGRSRVRGRRRVGKRHVHAVRIEAEDIAGNLREDRREALAGARCARADLHAVAQHLHDAPADVGVSHAEAGVLERAGHAGPGAGSLELLLHGEQAFLDRGVRSGHLPVGERVAGPHRVAEAYLPRRESGLDGQGIESALEGEAHLGHSEAPEGSGRWIVGVDGDSVDIDVRAGVGSSGMGDGTVQDGTPERRVRSRVGRDPLLEAHEHAPAVAADPQIDGHGMPLDVDAHALGPAEGALHRPSGEPREKGRDVLDGLVFLSAEPPSHVRRGHPHLFQRKAEGFGNVPLPVIHVLLPGAHEDHAVAVGRIGKGALGLHEGVVREGRGEGCLHHVGGGRERPIGVAPLHGHAGEHVPRGVDRRGIRERGRPGESARGP